MIIIIRILGIWLISFSIQAQQSLTVVSGLNKPPYVIQKNNSGFELELIRAIIQRMGKTVDFQYANFGRTSKMLDMSDIDAIMTTNARVFTDPSVLSQPYIKYQNVAVSLAENNLSIERVAELGRYKIVSFQMAHKILGREFQYASLASPLYSQLGDQSKQPGMLFRKRADVLVMDKRIFFYMLQQSAWADQTDKVMIHPIFPTTEYSMAFKDKQNVGLFNAELTKFLNSKEYVQLRKKYAFD